MRRVKFVYNNVGFQIITVITTFSYHKEVFMDSAVLKNMLADPSCIFSVDLSLYADANEIKKELRLMKCHFSDTTEKMLDMLRIREKGWVKCIVVSVEDLGFEHETPYCEVCARAISFGLQYCPPMFGPQYRLWYGDQPEGECLFVAMNALSVSDGCPGIFSILNIKNTLWLGWQNGSDNYRCVPEFRFIFQIPCEFVNPHAKV